MMNLQGEELAGSRDPRGARPAITTRRLEAIWPEARERVIRSVVCRGADPQTAEDIAQEVALRAMDNQVPFHDVDDFCGWACRVARNLFVDHTRSRGRFVGLVDLPDQADGNDLHGEVENRLALSRTLRAMERLDQNDRAAIVAGVNETAQPSRKAAVRMAVRRHRARARLLRLVEGIAAFWVIVRTGKRSVQLAPVTVAACGILAAALPVIHQFDGDSLPDVAAEAPRADSVTSLTTTPRKSADVRGPTVVAPPSTKVVHTVAPSRPGKTGSTRQEIVAVPGGGPTVGTESSKGDRCAVESGSNSTCHLRWPQIPVVPPVPDSITSVPSLRP